MTQLNKLPKVTFKKVTTCPKDIVPEGLDDRYIEDTRYALYVEGEYVATYKNQLEALDAHDTIIAQYTYITQN